MRKNIHRTAEQWQQIIEEQLGSNLTQKAYCSEQGISLSTFTHWKRKLLANDPTEADASWIDLTHGLSELAPPPSGWKIELDLGNGVVLRLSQQG